MTTTNDAPAPAPSGSRVRTGAEMIARHRFRLDADNNTAEVDSNGLAEEIDAALASLASDASPRGEPDMRRVCEALGFDPTNHHNAAKCPYCTPAHPAPATVEISDAMIDAGCAAWVELYPAFKGEKPPPTAGDVVKAILTAALAPATEGRKG